MALPLHLIAGGTHHGVVLLTLGGTAGYHTKVRRELAARAIRRTITVSVLVIDLAVIGFGDLVVFALVIKVEHRHPVVGLVLGHLGRRASRSLGIVESHVRFKAIATCD